MEYEIDREVGLVEQVGNSTLYLGDCLDILPGVKEVDAVVTDPPYGLGFMGKDWDHSVPGDRFWLAVLDACKPGAHLLAFGGTRTFHRLVCAIEDAGFEIRDTILWVYGSGFPKSLDVSKAIDKRPGISSHYQFSLALKNAMITDGYTNSFDVAEKVVGKRTGAVANWLKYQFPLSQYWKPLKECLPSLENKWEKVLREAERKVVGQSKHRSGIGNATNHHYTVGGIKAEKYDITAPATEAAKQWEGWGTALKPAVEMICLARKPLTGTVAANVLEHGTGGLNIDKCRVPTDETFHLIKSDPAKRSGVVGSDLGISSASKEKFQQDQAESIQRTQELGRFPANLIHDGSEEVIELFPITSSGKQAAGGHVRNSDKHRNVYAPFEGQRCEGDILYGDSGSAARFFYCAKASKADRGEGNTQPTVKPVNLMRYLCRLITPPGGTILDPFMGSGSTGKAAILEGFKFVGIEKGLEAYNVARDRLAKIKPQIALNL